MHIDYLATIYVKPAMSCIESLEGGSIYENSCNYRRRYFHHRDLARQFRDGHPATQGITEIQAVAHVLHVDLDDVVVSCSEDASRESSRVLSELLWSAFAHLLAGDLGGHPRLRLRTDPMGDRYDTLSTGEGGDVLDLSLYEWDDFHH